MFVKKIISSLVLGVAALASQMNAAEYSGIRMDNVNIKNQGEIATVAPGETFGVHAAYEFLFTREKGSIVQIIVGYDGIGAQTCIVNGVIVGESYYDQHSNIFRRQWNDVTKKEVDFALVAPNEPGVY
jgi:hypothetical protein